MGLRDSFKISLKREFPNDWMIAPLGDLSIFITSGSRGWASFYSERGATFIRSQNIRAGSLDFEDHQCVTPPQGAEGSRTKVMLGDVLVTITGNSVGNVASLDQDIGEAYISQHVGLVRLKDATAAKYVSMFLAPGAPGNDQIVSGQSGQSKPGLNLKNIQDFLIGLPPSSERESIATALSDVDALTAGLAKLIAKKRDLKQAAMQQLLTGQTRLPGFSGEWVVKRLGEHLMILKNGVNSRAELGEEGGVPYLHYGDIHGSQSLFLNPLKIAMPTLPASKAKSLDRLQNGDLVFADASEDLDGVGKSVEVQIADDFELVSGQHTIAVRFDKTVLSDGFKAYMQFLPAFGAHLRRLAAGTKVYATNRAHIASAELKLPGVDEQSAIAAVLSDMDTELSALESRLVKTRDLKQGMMQELLTGRTRLI